MELTGKQNRKRHQIIKTGQKNFREFCNAMNPEFFRPSRKFQDILCNTLQAIYEKELINPKTGKPYDILVVSLPPGHGKSYTAGMFCMWAYGQDISNQVITVSYNGTLSTRFAKTVRDHIEDKEIPDDTDYYVVNSFFPNLKIKSGDGAMDLWSLEGSYMSYLATSFEGSITGMRGNIGIIDDPIKNKEEAVNEKVKKKHWDWYKNTFTSRMVEGAIQIIIQTRWATDDLAGRIISKFPDRTYVLNMPVLNENDEPLCDEILSYDAIMEKKDTLDEDIWLANYMQEPIDKKGGLYKGFKYYDFLPSEDFEMRIAYIDTADEGTDNLCCIGAGVKDKLGYVLDIYYTDAPMEVTEEKTAIFLLENDIRYAVIESNNGGKGFARAVEKILQTKYHSRKCNITWFHQSKNKRARILVNASNVMNQLLFPQDLSKRYEKYYFDMIKWQRTGKNAHDDAPDATTGLVEVINGDVKVKSRWGWYR